MIMRIQLLLLAFFVTICHAQDNEQIGMICLVPYVPDEMEINVEARQYLLDKLSQIATAGGLSGQGVDNRFVITANICHLNKTTTSTIPQKTVMHLSVSIYIGDGISGTLFASANKEVKGVGNDETDAYISAIRNIPTRAADFQNCVYEGKKRIIEYYDKMANGIICSAKANAEAGEYQEATNLLLTIPVQCKDYQNAQALVAEISKRQIDNENQEMLANARAAWGASPDRNGASRAKEYLDNIHYPSPDVSKGIMHLCSSMSSRLSEIDNQVWMKEIKEVQNRHKKEMALIDSQNQRTIAYINAAASVARVYAANRPRVVYRIYNWW